MAGSNYDTIGLPKDGTKDQLRKLAELLTDRAAANGPATPVPLAQAAAYAIREQLSRETTAAQRRRRRHKPEPTGN